MDCQSTRLSSSWIVLQVPCYDVQCGFAMKHCNYCSELLSPGVIDSYTLAWRSQGTILDAMRTSKKELLCSFSYETPFIFRFIQFNDCRLIVFL